MILLSAIISVDVIGIGLVLGQEDTNLRVIILWTFLILSALVVVFSWTAKEALKWRFSRVLEKFTQVTKIEGLLGLREEISTRLQGLHIFTDDVYLFQRYDSTGRKHKTSKDWIDAEIKAGNSTYTDSKKVFWITALVGVLLFIIYAVLIILYMAAR